MQPTRINVFSPQPAVKPADLERLVGAVASDARWLHAATWYEFAGPTGRLRLNVRGEDYWVDQRDGLKGYASGFLTERDDQDRFALLVDAFRSIYSIFSEHPIAFRDPTWSLLERIARSVDGVLFAWGSIVIPERFVLFGPLAEDDRPAGASRADGPLSASEDELRGTVRTTRDHPEPTKAQLARRERSDAAIAALGLPVNPHLPLIEDVAALATRTPGEVVRRMLCAGICAVKAEEDDPAFIAGLVQRYGVGEWLTPDERAFLGERAADERRRARFSWRYEGIQVFQWWLGMIDRLPPPTAICDVGATVRRMHERTCDQLIAEARPRAADALLDQLDLHYRLHWAAIELRLRNQPSAAVHEGIVYERHYALNWLIRYRDAEWDDVPTDT